MLSNPLPPLLLFFGLHRSSADALIALWHTKARLLQSLLHTCRAQPALHLYESFERRGGDVPADTPDWLLPCYRGDARSLPADTRSTVRRAHSHDIREFVQNADHVEAHFAAARYPSFWEVFKRYGVAEGQVRYFGDMGRQRRNACGGKAGAGGEEKGPQ
jgi:hypothetical protein